jgi:uncharacterized FlaG/YvyC family protein
MVPIISTTLPTQNAGQSAQAGPPASLPVEDSGGNGQSSNGSTGNPTQVTSEQLQKSLAATLKNTGFTSEVDTSNPDQVVVKIVDGVTGRLVLQIPSTTALVIAEALRKGTLDPAQPQSGAIFDEAA